MAPKPDPSLSPPFALARFGPDDRRGEGFTLLTRPAEILSGKGRDLFPALRRIEEGGDWFGFLGYELGEVTESVPTRRACSWGIPDFWFARFSDRSMIDLADSPNPLPEVGGVDASLTRTEHRQGLRAIQSYLEAGDVYQTNLTVQFETEAPPDPLALFHRLDRASQSAYSCFLDLGDWKILSLSPELFLHIEEGRVVTRPIKGTIGRTGDPHADQAALEWLRSNPKNLAELLMIVDLERNDLGRFCRYGSVKVDSFPEIIDLPHLYHLCATVRGELREGATLTDILCSTFPGGSISGAPKRRALEVIRELEPHRRGPYCGAVGYLSSDSVHLNLAIRTGVWREGRFRFWAGGGIVVDHDPESEQREIVDKLTPFIRTLGLDRERFWGES